jgi:hypothetical protein
MKQSQPVTRILRKSTPALIAVVMAVGLLASATRGLAVTMTWIDGNAVWNSTTAWQTNIATGLDPVSLTNLTCVASDLTNVTATCAPGGVGAFPGTGDSAVFTNSPVVTINISTNVRNIEVSNAVVSFVAGASTLLTVTDTFSVGSENVSALTTATVYWGGGTLAVTNGGAANVEIGTGTNEMGQLYVTNGVVVYDENHPPSTSDTGMTIGGVASAGKLVISGSGVVTNGVADTATISIRGSATMTSQLIITNGGKLFFNGATETKSNVFVLVSDPGSILSNSLNTGSSVLSIGVNNLLAPGSLMIVSNGATVWSEGTISFGRGSSFNTGYVCGAGSRLISDTNGGFVIGITGGSSNALVVYNGGYVRSGGLVQVPDSAISPNNLFQVGGTGAMSTGLLVQVRQNSGSQFGSIIVTNAVLTCSMVEIEGGPSNSLSVLSNGTLIFSNQYAVSATTTNVLITESFVAGYGNAIMINAGTMSAVSGSNAVQIEIGSSGEPGAASLTITNGGRLLSELVELGDSSSYNTAVVTGAGSVWSNYTAGVNYVNTNKFSVGVGTTVPPTYNYLAVQNGALLVNNGNLEIGASSSASFDAALFGGPGAPAVIIVSTNVEVGGSGSSDCSLTVSNASLTCEQLLVGASTNVTDSSLVFNGGTISANYAEIGGTSTVAFTAGTLAVGGLTFDNGANSGNAFVVGDGTDAATYEMAGNGNGYHNFGTAGLVVTNGATLSGDGTLAGAVTVLGTFVPGPTPNAGAIFTTGNIAFGEFANLDYALGTNNNNYVLVSSNLTLGGTLYVTDSGGFGAGTYVLFANFLTESGTLSLGSLPAGYTGFVSNDVPNSQRILLIVSSSGPPAGSYAAWAFAYFGGTNCVKCGGNADYDGTGMSNTNKYMAGFNPINSAAYLHVISIVNSNGNARVTYLGANGDSSYSGGPTTRTNVLEFTTGTANGSYTNNFVSTGQTNVLSGGTGLGVVTNMVDSGGATNKPSRYYRVRVLLP